MSVQTSALNFNSSLATVGNWRSRVLAIFLMVAIAGIFWVDSRYPRAPQALSRRHATQSHGRAHFRHRLPGRSLNAARNARMAHHDQLARRQSHRHDLFVPLRPRGTHISCHASPPTISLRYLNTLFGAAAGVPLAVCSNCIAPIARGLFASGMSAESVLATMFASPALNVVVLAMTFALFPVSIALIKLATVLFLIFVLLPPLPLAKNCKKPPSRVPSKFLPRKPGRKLRLASRALSPRASGTSREWPCR